MMRTASRSQASLAFAIALALLGGGAHATTITVSEPGDDGNPATCTLRQAIQSAIDDGNAGSSLCLAGNGDDVVNFAPKLVDADIYLSQGALTISGGTLNLQGSGQTIYGDSSSQVLSVTSATLIASKLTLSHEQPSPIGRGMYADKATVTLNDTVITGNSCTTCFGAGIYLHHASSLTLTDSTISANSSGKSGGGIMVYTGDNVTLINSTISGNSAAWNGGGMYAASDATVVNSTVAGNSASNAAGIFSTHNNLTLTQSTVTGNSAPHNPGLWGHYATIVVANAIIADNDDRGPGVYNYDSTINIRHSLLDADMATSYAGNGNRFSDSPGLAPLADNGGPTRTIALSPGSSALNAGDPMLSLGPDNIPLNFDQRGPGYPRAFEGLVDIGAFQHQGDRIFADGLEPGP